MLDQLLACDGVEERCALGSGFGFLALHGGLEGGTAEIAHGAAIASGASLYAVVQPHELRFHVPSHEIAPLHSPALTAFLEHVDVVVSVHGFGGLPAGDQRRSTALVGGSNRGLAARLAASLRAQLPEYAWLDELDAMPSHLRGVHPENPVNLPRAGGVQLELPWRLRRSGADLAVLISALAALAAAP